MRAINRAILFILLTFCCHQAAGQTFSYLYIQGDKETPIYVKMEDEMQPRYGKNYCIISQLAPGPVHIQVLFQQNKYPPQSFTIQVPENSYRGFIVTHKDDQFSLFDLQQKTYIPAGVTTDNSTVPVKTVSDIISATPTKETTTNTVNSGAAITPPAAHVLAPTTTLPVNNDDVAAKKAHIDSLVAINTKTIKKPKDQPQFIDNLVLDNQKTLQADNDISINHDTRNIIPNSDCPTPMDNSLFENIYMQLKDKKGDERVKYLLQHTRHCFSCNQVQLLAQELNTDPQRYAFLKQVYPRITDQGNFRYLERLFSSAEWKSYFLLIAQ